MGGVDAQHHAVSIHAPREGCDFAIPLRQVHSRVSIHAPREGCDGASTVFSPPTSKFQSTHPVRGATLLPQTHAGILTVSIHAPREGCDDEFVQSRGGHSVSIHAPREGCDPRDGPVVGRGTVFQSTHPVRGATHTPGPARSRARCFNPRTP